MRKKREDVFSVGVRLVWEIDPKARTVQVYSIWLLLPRAGRGIPW